MFEELLFQQFFIKMWTLCKKEEGKSNELILKRFPFSQSPQWRNLSNTVLHLFLSSLSLHKRSHTQRHTTQFSSKTKGTRIKGKDRPSNGARKRKEKKKLIPLFLASSERELKFYFVGIIAGTLERRRLRRRIFLFFSFSSENSENLLFWVERKVSSSGLIVFQDPLFSSPLLILWILINDFFHLAWLSYLQTFKDEWRMMSRNQVINKSVPLHDLQKIRRISFVVVFHLVLITPNQVQT